MSSTSNLQISKSGCHLLSGKCEAPREFRYADILLVYISGPKRYDYSVNEMGWYYSRDGQSIGGLLEGELSEALGRTVTLGLDKVPS